MAEDSKKKDDLDLDFSEMDGTTDKVDPPDQPLKVVKPRKGWDPSKKRKKRKNDDPVLCVPVAEGWMDRSITDCSPEEFVTWFETVYPGVRCGPEDFQTRANRLSAFKHVLQESIRMKFDNIEHAKTKN